MSFSEVREYQFGDDVRNIDWNVTARFETPFVKVYEEEREMTVMLLIDVSGSENVGSRSQTKREMLTELAAVLAFSAIQNNDKIGALLFSDQIELFIPPRKGKSHVLRIVRDLLNFEPQSKGTDINQALRFFTGVIKKRSTAFLISDFISNQFQDSLKIAGRKHDLIALAMRDMLEQRLPKAGLVQVQDAETGEIKLIDTASKKVRSAFKAHYLKREQDLLQMFNRSGIDYAFIDTHKSYVQPLQAMFRRRELRR